MKKLRNTVYLLFVSLLISACGAEMATYKEACQQMFDVCLTEVAEGKDRGVWNALGDADVGESILSCSEGLASEPASQDELNCIASINSCGDIYNCQGL